jgi:Diacylglycerol kinase catalytic domain
MKVTVIHNPGAGDDAQPSGNQIMRFIRKAGHKAKYFSTEDKKWEKALKRPCDIVAVAGGDGTVGDVARRLVDSISDHVAQRRPRVKLMRRQERHLQVEWKRSQVHIDDMTWPEEQNNDPVLSIAIDIKINPGALVFPIPS